MSRKTNYFRINNLQDHCRAIESIPTPIRHRVGSVLCALLFCFNRAHQSPRLPHTGLSGRGCCWFSITCELTTTKHKKHRIKLQQINWINAFYVGPPRGVWVICVARFAYYVYVRDYNAFSQCQGVAHKAWHIKLKLSIKRRSAIDTL